MDHRLLMPRRMGGFSPLSYGSDLALWLDPSYGVYTDRSTQLAAASSQYWSSATNSGATNKLTISFWAKPVGVSGFFVLTSECDVGASMGWNASQTNALARIFFGASGAYGDCSAYSAGAWSHVTYVYDGTLSGNANRLKIYVNGAAQTVTFTGTIPASMSVAGQVTEIGRYPGGSYFDGCFDSFLISPVALSAADVTAIYNAGAGLIYASVPAAQLTAIGASGRWYDFDGDGLDAHGSNDLTAVNSPTYTSGIASGVAGDGDLVSLIVPRVGPNLVPPSYAKRTIWNANGGMPYFQNSGSWGYDFATVIAQTADAQVVGVYTRHASDGGGSGLLVNRVVISGEPACYVPAGAPSMYTDNMHPSTADAMSVGQRSVVMMACSGATIYSRLNNGSLRSEAGVPSARSNWTHVFDHTYGQHLFGKLADLLILKRILSTAEETQLRNYLAAKNGVTL